MKESIWSFSSVNVRCRPAQKTSASTSGPCRFTGVSTVIAVALPSTLAIGREPIPPGAAGGFFSSAPVGVESAARLPAHHVPEQRGGAHDRAPPAEGLAAPVAQRERVDLGGDQLVAEPEPRVDVV